MFEPESHSVTYITENGILPLPLMVFIVLACLATHCTIYMPWNDFGITISDAICSSIFFFLFLLVLVHCGNRNMGLPDWMRNYCQKNSIVIVLPSQQYSMCMVPIGVEFATSQMGNDEKRVADGTTIRFRACSWAIGSLDVLYVLLYSLEFYFREMCVRRSACWACNYVSKRSKCCRLIKLNSTLHTIYGSAEDKFAHKLNEMQ